MSKPFSTSNRDIYFILGLAFVLRLLWVLCVPNVQVSDAVLYKTIAHNLANTGSYFFETYKANTAPGYPFFLSLFYKIGIDSDLVVKCVQVLLSTVSVYFLFAICASFFNRNVARAAGLFYAMYLNHIVYCGLLLTETLFTFLLLWYVWLWVFSKGKYTWVLLAAVLAALVYVKPQALVLGFLISAYFGVKNRTTLRMNASHFILMLVLISGWIVRNKLSVGHFTLSTNSAYNMYIGNNDHATGKYETYGLQQSMNEYDEVFWYRNELRSHHMPLAQVPGLLAMKFYYLFITDAESIRYWTLQGITDDKLKEAITPWKHFCMIQYIIIILGCGLAVMAMVLRRIKIPILFFIPLIFIVVLQLVYFGDARFHFPAMPFLLPVAVLGWMQLPFRPGKRTTAL